MTDVALKHGEEGGPGCYEEENRMRQGMEWGRGGECGRKKELIDGLYLYAYLVLFDRVFTQ